MRLKGKVAVVTGGAKGLGMEMALRFANEGAKVIAADMSELSYKHDNVEGFILNVSDSEACKVFFDNIMREFVFEYHICEDSALPVMDTIEVIYG